MRRDRCVLGVRMCAYEAGQVCDRREDVGVWECQVCDRREHVGV